VAALSVVGILAFALLFVCANVLVSRFYQRWDFTSSGLYTLSEATDDVLARLEQPVDVLVLLSEAEPLTLRLRHLLDAYAGKNPDVRARFIDPDRSPGEFLALQQKYGLLDATGAGDTGRTEPSVIFVQNERHWIVSADELASFDASGQVESKLEQAVTEALARLLGGTISEVCFTQGHQEMPFDSGGAQGLSELRYDLERHNFKTRPLDLTRPDVDLSPCDLVVVAGPNVPFGSKAADALRRYLKGGGGVGGFARVSQLHFGSRNQHPS
jgi:hypothetical protein